jgi:hypothetical protein
VDLSAAIWRTSVRSGNNGGNCVEVAVIRGRDAGHANKADEEFVILVRDSKNRDREPQVFTGPEWDDFLEGVRNGEFDSSTLIEELRTASATI